MCSVSDGYPDNWKEIATAVKDRAGWRCENPDCGHANDWAAGYVLTVHHRDGNPMNNAPENTVALCQRCHMVACARQSKYGREDDRQMRLWPARLAKGAQSTMFEHATHGLVTGLCIGLCITLAVGVTGVVLGQLCIWPVAPWCAW